MSSNPVKGPSPSDPLKTQTGEVKTSGNTHRKIEKVEKVGEIDPEQQSKARKFRAFVEEETPKKKIPPISLPPLPFSPKKTHPPDPPNLPFRPIVQQILWQVPPIPSLQPKTTLPLNKKKRSQLPFLAQMIFGRMSMSLLKINRNIPNSLRKKTESKKRGKKLPPILEFQSINPLL